MLKHFDQTLPLKWYVQSLFDITFKHVWLIACVGLDWLTEWNGMRQQGGGGASGKNDK